MIVKNRMHGFTQLELVITVLVIAALMAFAYVRLEEMRATVEKASYQGALSKIQTQLTLNVASWYSRGELQSRRVLEQKNPLGLIKEKPTNYGGELELSRMVHQQDGRWYFITDKGWLVYKPKWGAGLEGAFEEQGIVPFALEIGMDHPDRDQGMVLNIELKPVNRFQP